VNDYSRIDNSGAFEYTYDNTDNFSVVLGGRIDNHNRLGILLRQDYMCDTILGRKEFCDFQQEEGTKLMFCRKSTALASSRTFDFRYQR
jgi:hypothetical protein